MTLTEIHKMLALLFEPGQVIGVSGIKLDGAMTKEFGADPNNADAFESDPEDREL
jgi:hypothetical protein